LLDKRAILNNLFMRISYYEFTWSIIMLSRCKSFSTREQLFDSSDFH